MTDSMRDLLNDAEDSLRTDFDEYYKDSQFPEDSLFDLVDGSVPVYTAELMAFTAEDISLATEEPELGPAFDGSPTPVNIVAANVFERIYAHLSSVLHELQEEAEDVSEDA